MTKMTQNIIIFILSCLILVEPTTCVMINDTDRLSSDLLKNYNKNTRGEEDQLEPTMLDLQFTVTSINGYDEVTGVFTLTGFFDIVWYDSRMTWYPPLYNGVEVITFPQTSVWVPVIVHANGNGDGGLVQLGKDWLLTRYLPDGTAFWSPGDLFKSFCAPAIRNYPYDTQKCSLNLIPWGYSPEEITFNLTRKDCRTDIYVPNGVWDLLNTSIYIRRLYHDDSDSYDMVVLEFTMKRRATFYVINMILPIATMGVMNLLVFLLPPESGERISYSITLLLAISVFLTIASDNLPKTSFPEISFLCVKLLVDVIISSFVVLFTILGLRFYHKDPYSEVPPCIASLTRIILCRCCTRRNKIKTDPQEKIRKESGKFNIYTNGKEGKVTAWADTNLPNTLLTQVTWAEVGKASDIAFFAIIFAAFSASNISYLMILNFA